MLTRFEAVASLVIASCMALPALAQATDSKTGTHPWWQHAVIYELYPRSFADSNHDGIGDLNGIADRMNYLKELGIDAIWITPCYPSPQKDFGYDVSDYESIDPMYGTVADFDKMQKKAEQEHIRIIMDFVLNHSSDQHKWFLDSKSSRTSAHRDWYIWRDGKGPGQPPNNWMSDFGGPAWQLDPATGQYYYHYFLAGQPDLNWRNPAVEKAMFDVTRFWYRHHVAGFRLDAVDTLFEDPQLHDNPVTGKKNDFGEAELINKYNDKLPENHQVLRRLRALADQNDAVLIGETWTSNIEELKEYYGANHDEIQLPIDFLFTTLPKISAPEYRKQIGLLDSAGGWPVYVLSNHDIIRSYTRYADGQNDDQIAKLMAGMYLTLRGTPILYYGEEIGMANSDPLRKEDVKDPLGIAGWPANKGRDGERTPMQWDDSAQAGFTSGTPWLPVAASYKTHNVASELKDPNSVLEFYRHLLALRHSNPALLDGDYIPLNASDPNVLSYLRSTKDASVLVLLNMSASEQKVNVDLAAQGFNHPVIHTLLSTTGPVAQQDHPSAAITLTPYSVYMGSVSRQ